MLLVNSGDSANERDNKLLWLLSLKIDMSHKTCTFSVHFNTVCLDARRASALYPVNPSDVQSCLLGYTAV
jgi:hypothetical protein